MNNITTGPVLPLHLGWDEKENPVIEDLAALPHLLVAGRKHS